MNQRERFLKIIQHEEPDRVMVYHNGFIGNTFNEWRDKIEDTLTDEDIVLDQFSGDRTTRAWIDDDFVEFAVNFHIIIHESNTKKKKILRSVRSGLLTSMAVPMPDDPIRGTSEQHLTHWRSVRKFMQNMVIRGMKQFLPPEEAFTEIKTKLHSLEERDYPWMPLNRLGSIWEYIFEGLGPRQIAYFSRKNPSALHQILKENMKSLYYCNERLLEEGAMVIGVSDDMGYKDHPLLSPNLFEEFLAPLYKRLTDLAHNHGAFFLVAFVWKHYRIAPEYYCCGS